ncbi:MAG: DUF87 domain-containing protein [Synergistaceae bacterium]|jgi:hypothetical protein|nr:DUF87 domain-containing protein [Synergistaceae bacterium]
MNALTLAERRNNMDADLKRAFANADSVIQKSYLEHLESLEVSPPGASTADVDVSRCGRFYRLDRLVVDPDEDFLGKMITVANSVAPLGCAIVTLAECDGEKVSYYIGIVAKNARQDNLKDEALRKAGADTFSGAMKGNFSGSVLTEMETGETAAIAERLFSERKSVASVSGVVSPRGNNGGPASYVQGLEKLVNSLGGKPYAILVIADPVGAAGIRAARRGYETLYTQLSAFQSCAMTVNESESSTLSESQTKSVTDGISEGITLSQSYGTNTSHSEGTNCGVHGGISFSPQGSPFGLSGGAYYGKSSGDTYGTSENSGSALSASRQSSAGKSDTVSSGKGSESGRSMTINIENRSVKTLLETIDAYLERLKSAENFGAFDCAAYILADSREDALSAAGHYSALLRGDNSYVQSSHINVWSPPAPSLSKKTGPDAFARVTRFLKSFTHPEFFLDSAAAPGSAERDFTVRPSSLVNGNELAVQFALPRKSLPGLTVMEMTPFGRNAPSAPGRKINLGALYYMGQTEPSRSGVCLNADSLTAHTFITGSTGAGKSNAVYGILNQLRAEETPFLVVEPAKGEYKNVFGARGVSVYGTDPRKSAMLRVNPFRFPRGVHVLEHLDRLVELFNVCWPMYAAMPAILKESMERAYADAGWDLAESENRHGEVFPTFVDLSEQIERVIDESKYSSDSKGDYTGALCTRVRSLTNGINGLIFCGGDLSDAQLFDESAIADLSRVGSTETKALIMGLMVMKLHEYRTSSAVAANLGLRHVTVLEEAHNILRRTSAEQFSESANLLGKSVELLANSIAEMRTYGEGFIIADQSPGLLDMSVIRNTNTKIILRLPDRGDRELVGRAAGLNDEQITELAKLERGVAAVYQNDWAEAVLAKINLCELQETPYSYLPKEDSGTAAKRDLIYLLIRGRADERPEFDAIRAELSLHCLRLPSRGRILLEKLFAEYRDTQKLEIWRTENFERLSRLVSDILGSGPSVEREVLTAKSNGELTERLFEIIRGNVPDASENTALAITQCLMKAFSVGGNERIREKIYKAWVEDERERMTL